MDLEILVDAKLAAHKFSKKEWSHLQKLAKGVHCTIRWKHNQFDKVFTKYNEEDYNKFIKIDNGWCLLDNIKIIGVTVSQSGWPSDPDGWPYGYFVDAVLIKYKGLEELEVRAGQTGYYKDAWELKYVL